MRSRRLAQAVREIGPFFAVNGFLINQAKDQ
jgi:hypothetical protein